MEEKKIAKIIGPSRWTGNYGYCLLFKSGHSGNDYYDHTEYDNLTVLADSPEEAEKALVAKGYTVLSVEEYDAIVGPILYAPRREAAIRQENERINRVFAVMEEEEEILIALREKYPLDQMAEELRRNPRPTLEQALERGLAWSALIPGEKDGRFFRIEADGSISSTALGALYIGCYGLTAVEAVKMACDTGIGRSAGNEAKHKVLDGIKDCIKSWKRRSGTYRDLNIHRSYYVSGAVRGSGHKRQTELWYEDILEHPLSPRTKYIEWARSNDAHLAAQLFLELCRWQQAQSEH